MVNRRTTQTKGISKSKDKKANYFECEKHGHFKRDCPTLKKEKKQKSSINIMNKNNSDDNGSNIPRDVLYVNLDCINNSWTLNSGATF